jgi:ABC-type uncharacterized transport system permease subunit
MKYKNINLLVDTVKLLLIVLIACLLISIIIFIVSDAPGEAIYSFFVGPFSSLRRIGNVLEGSIPLMFTALAVTIIFRCGQFSMIAEGSFFIGIMGAMIVGISLPMNSFLHPIVAIAFAGLLGAIVASVPAILKLKWGVTEVVVSIMLNYVVQFFVIYMVNYHFREPLASSLASLKIATTAQLPGILEGTKVHLGLIIALVCSLLSWFFIFRSRLGFKIRAVGDNASFANYAGIKAPVVMVTAQIIAGAIAGMGGGVELLGMYTRFKWTSTPGYGWTGIAVALLARKNPIMIPIAAAFIAYLDVGAGIMARNSDVSNEIVLIIQGVMMLLIASDALLHTWRQRLVVSSVKQEMSVAQTT